MNAHELIKKLERWPDMPVYFEYELLSDEDKAESAESKNRKMVAEPVSGLRVKMVLKGPASEGGLITAVVLSGTRT